jgi:hypothetical protein
MLSKHYIFFVFVSVIFVFSACRKNAYEATGNRTDFEYLPLALGNTWTYHIDSTGYNDFDNSIESFGFTEKEVIDAQLSDPYGDSLYRVSVYRYDTSSSQWNLRTSYSIQITDFKAIKADSAGKEFVLRFPLTQWEFWDGNLFNSSKEQLYEVQYVDQFELLNELEFDSTALIVKRNISNSLITDQEEEIYAKHVGLISRSKKFLRKQTSSQSIPDGYEIKYTLLEYEVN